VADIVIMACRIAAVTLLTGFILILLTTPKVTMETTETTASKATMAEAASAETTTPEVPRSEMPPRTISGETVKPTVPVES